MKKKNNINKELGIGDYFYVPVFGRVKIKSTTPSKISNFKGKTFTFIGDSYTATPKYGWQSIMSNNYGLKEVNIAKGGKQTKWMVEAVKNYLTNHKPDYLVIFGGANDAYSSIPIGTSINNIQKMIDLANAYGVKPIVVTGYNARKVQVGNPRQKPTKQQLGWGITQQKLWGMGENYYQMQLKMLSDLKKAIVVPIWQDGVQSSTYDGLHMTWDANKKFGIFVGKYLFG